MAYEDIDKLLSEQNNLLEQQQNKENEIIDTQTQQNVDSLERQKQEADKEAVKTNKALYTNYQKEVNPYGINAEQQASNGLANSGYAESSKVNLYNTYQKNVTETLNTAKKIKSDFDIQISTAKQNGDVQKAKSAANMYATKMNQLYQAYQLRNDYEQFLYQKERDTIGDNQWQQQWEEQKKQNQQTQSNWEKEMEYQKQRDSVSDSRWEKEFALSQAKKSSSGSSSSKKASSTASSVDLKSDSELGEYATQLKYNLSIALKNSGKANGLARTQAQQAIYNAYETNKITDSEASTLYNSLGFSS